MLEMTALFVYDSASNEQVKLPPFTGQNYDSEQHNQQMMLSMMKAGGVNTSSLSAADTANLDWKSISDLFGGGRDEQPILPGWKETCTDQEDGSNPFRYIGVSGTFNSGTNLLSKLLTDNCDFRKNDNDQESKQGGRVLWQVPWGKHGFAHTRNQRTADGYEDYNKDEVLTVVVTRSPYDWMLSMCRNSYTIDYDIQDGDATTNCPYLLHPKTGEVVSVRYGKKKPGIPFDSVVDFWNKWHSEYIDGFPYPRLIVRLEDLTMRPHEIIEAVCKCGGRSLKTSAFRNVVSNPKAGLGHGEESEKNGLLEAWLRLGKPVDIEESQYSMAKNSLNRTLMDLFWYKDSPRKPSS